MGKRKQKDDRSSSAQALGHNPFAALGGLREELPEGEGERAPERAAAAPAAGDAAVPTRAVARLERKGRRGKDVTILELRGLPAEALSGWLRDLRRGLGCGGAVEDEVIVLQGDQRERLPAWLAGRGVTKVSVG